MNHPFALPPLSKCRWAGDLLFISGQLPRDGDGAIVPGGISVQAERALANLVAILESEALTVRDVVKVTVWLTDAAFADAFNAVYRTVFAEPYPARSVVISGLVAAAHVEIEAIARRP